MMVSRIGARCLAALAGSFVFCWFVLELRTSLCILVSLVLGYSPSYFCGSEYTLEGRFWPEFVRAQFAKNFFRRWVPSTLTTVHQYEANRQWIIGSSPHGVASLSHGIFLTDGLNLEKLVPGIHNKRRDIAASIVFWVPVWRELCLWWGCIHPSRSMAQKVLRDGNSLVVLPGGMDEQILPTDDRRRQVVIVRKNPGFLRLALEHGVPVIPSFCFGENELFVQSSVAYSFRRTILKRFRIPICIWRGRYGWFIPVPFPVSLHSVLGAPIEVAQVDNPSPEQIEALRNTYVKQLIEIFEKNKSKYGYGDSELIVRSS